MLKHFLNNDTKKYNKNCQLILAEKIRKNLVHEYLRKYRGDLNHSLANNLTFISLLRSVERIRNFSDSLPYLSKLLVIPTEFQSLNKKAFYDQKKMKIVEQEHRSGFDSIYYIESKEELLEDWKNISYVAVCYKTETSIDIESYIKSIGCPPVK